MTGPPESAGARLHAAVDDPHELLSRLLVLTDRRLLLLATDIAWVPPYALLFEAPRAELVSLVPKGRLVRVRQRVLLTFADGSTRVLLLGFRPQARDLIAAAAG